MEAGEPHRLHAIDEAKALAADARYDEDEARFFRAKMVTGPSRRASERKALLPCWLDVPANGNPSITLQELVAFVGDLLARGFWGDITIRVEREIKSIRIMTVVLPGALRNGTQEGENKS